MVNKRIVFAFFIILTLSINAYAMEKVTLQLNWKYQFEFAGYIAAKEKGFYKDAGLDVKIIQYNGGSVLKKVLSQKVDFGIADSDIFASMILNKPVILLANFFKRSPLVLAVKPSIITPGGLKNKKIMADENEFELTSLGLMLHKFHIKLKDIFLTKETYSIKPFIQNKVDAMAIYITNQPYKLNKLHIKYNIIDPSNYGIFTYSGNLFTSQKELKEKPQIVKRFVEASIRGWKYALAHKAEIAGIIYDKYSKSKSIGALMFEANAIEHIIMPDVFAIGSINKSVVSEIIDEFEDIMHIKKQPLNLNRFIYKNKNNSSLLTNKEIAFIKKHKVIKICTNPDWVPIEYLSNGKAKGISIGVLNKIHNMTGLIFKRIPTNSWSQSQIFLREKKCDLLPSAVKTYKRERFALFTKPYMHYELFMFAKNDKSFVNGIESLIDKPMARNRGSGLINKLKKLYPSINIVKTSSYKQSFEYVEKGKVYYTVATLPVADYIIKKYGFKDIVIIGDTGMGYNLSMAVRKDMPMLVDVLNKGLSRITSKNLDMLYMEQINLQKMRRYNMLIIKILIISTAIFMALFLIIYIINKTNKRLKETKERLEESLKNFEILTNSTIQTIIIYKDDICIDANDVACRMLGYKTNELIGKHISKLFSDSSKKMVMKKVKEEHTAPYEVEFIKKDGTSVYALAKGDTIMLNGEKVRVGSAVDITELKKLQDELRNLNATLEKRIEEALEKNREKDTLMMQQSKLASMGEMLSMIAHQWRQPLNTISTNISTLLLKIELGSYDKELLKQKLNNMSNYVKHLSETIEDFRDFFRQDKEKNRVCIDHVIDDTLKIVKEHIESKQIDIILDLQCKNKVEIYANELKHVILNLINNARDVLIERGVQNPCITIKTYEINDKTFIKVSDNGGGIEKTVLEKIFKPYFTTKSSRNGTGLGLYMSKIIVEGHLKGQLNVANRKDGAEFSIILYRTP